MHTFGVTVNEFYINWDHFAFMHMLSPCRTYAEQRYPMALLPLSTSAPVSGSTHQQCLRKKCSQSHAFGTVYTPSIKAQLEFSMNWVRCSVPCNLLGRAWWNKSYLTWYDWWWLNFATVCHIAPERRSRSFSPNHNTALTQCLSDPSFSIINTLWPIQNARHFADGIFKCIFLNANVWMLIDVARSQLVTSRETCSI